MSDYEDHVLAAIAILDAEYEHRRAALVSALDGLVDFGQPSDNDDAEEVEAAPADLGREVHAVDDDEAAIAAQLARTEAERAAQRAEHHDTVRVIEADVLDDTEVEAIRESITPKAQHGNARYNETDILRVARHAHSEGRSVGAAIRDELGMSNASAYEWAKRLKSEGKLDVAPTAATPATTPRFGVEDAMGEIDGAA